MPDRHSDQGPSGPDGEPLRNAGAVAPRGRNAAFLAEAPQNQFRQVSGRNGGKWRTAPDRRSRRNGERYGEYVSRREHFRRNRCLCGRDHGGNDCRNRGNRLGKGNSDGEKEIRTLRENARFSAFRGFASASPGRQVRNEKKQKSRSRGSPGRGREYRPFDSRKRG